jgi:hypothetical protein
MAKKKKKTTSKEKAPEVEPVADSTSKEDTPEVKKEAPAAPAPAPKASTAGEGFPPFGGGGYNDFVAWKAQKADWEANNG